MAIVNSTALGKATKTAGQLTYRRVRDRIIASQRVTENKSNTPAQEAQRNSFRTISQALAQIGFVLKRAYEPSKNGSSRNRFYSMNKDLLAGISDLNEATSPFEVVDKLVNASLPFFTYGGGNGTVSGTPNSADLPDNVVNMITFRAYDVAEGDCKMTKIEINEDGTVSTQDDSAQIQYDAASMTATYESEGGIGAQKNYQFFIMETPNGIVKSKFIVSTYQGGGE